jgi:hypothetical protein
LFPPDPDNSPLSIIGELAEEQDIERVELADVLFDNPINSSIITSIA